MTGYQTAVCVCEYTIWTWVFGCWYNQAIERCTQTEGPVGAMRKGRHCDNRCVCVCVLGAVDYTNVAVVNGRGREFLSHRQSLLLSALLVNEDL